MGYSKTGFYSFIACLLSAFVVAFDCVALAGLKLRNLSAYPSWVLRLKVCVTMLGFLTIF